MRINRVIASSLALVASATLISASAATAAPTKRPPLQKPPHLKNGSWTAKVAAPIVARTGPGTGKAVKLPGHTQWSLSPTVYMVNGSKDVKNVRWVRIQLPNRPNGRTAWVREDQVVLKKIRTFVRVSTKAKRVEVFLRGKRIRVFSASVGTGGTPTPKGTFSVYDTVPTTGPLGPHILVLSAHSNVLKTFDGGNGVVGIHGWSSRVGRAESHGCVRLSQSAIKSLNHVVKPGTPVQIL